MNDSNAAVTESLEQESADWCVTEGDLSICGTRMVEHSRKPVGVKWCFRCRKRNEFAWVVRVPDGPSYYGPDGHHECGGCGGWETDLFPGWTREYEEDR